jgi:hypothetical protein
VCAALTEAILQFLIQSFEYEIVPNDSLEHNSSAAIDELKGHGSIVKAICALWVAKMGFAGAGSG